MISNVFATKAQGETDQHDQIANPYIACNCIICNYPNSKNILCMENTHMPIQFHNGLGHYVFQSYVTCECHALGLHMSLRLSLSLSLRDL